MKYAAILADPAWGFKNYSAKGEAKNPNQHYACMTVAEIAALPVKDLRADDCACFIWTTGPFLEATFSVAKAWGFSYSTTGFTWVKQGKDEDTYPIGTGYWTRANPEYCLLFTHGSPKRLAADVQELILAPRREHSRKPDEVHERIERLVGGPYIELFGRRERPGWTVLGNEVDGEDLLHSIARVADQRSFSLEFAG